MRHHENILLRRTQRLKKGQNDPLLLANARQQAEILKKIMLMDRGQFDISTNSIDNLKNDSITKVRKVLNCH